MRLVRQRASHAIARRISRFISRQHESAVPMVVVVVEQQQLRRRRLYLGNTSEFFILAANCTKSSKTMKSFSAEPVTHLESDSS